MEIGKVHHHTPQTRKKGQGQWTQTIKGVGVENPQIFLRFLSLEICFPEKKMATKVPIGAGLSLASPPCASNVRSLVLKSAFFGHGGTVLSDSLSGCCSNFVSSV